MPRRTTSRRAGPEVVSGAFAEVGSIYSCRGVEQDYLLLALGTCTWVARPPAKEVGQPTCGTGSTRLRAPHEPHPPTTGRFPTTSTPSGLSNTPVVWWKLNKSEKRSRGERLEPLSVVRISVIVSLSQNAFFLFSIQYNLNSTISCERPFYLFVRLSLYAIFEYLTVDGSSTSPLFVNDKYNV